MPKDTDNHSFGSAGGDSDPLGGLLADMRPPVEPMSSERTQQIFRDALRQSGVTTKRPARYGMRLWFAVSLPAGALAGAAVLAVIAHKSPNTNAGVKAADKYVHVNPLPSDRDLHPALPPHRSSSNVVPPPPVVIHKPRIARKSPPALGVKRSTRPQIARSGRSRVTPMLAKLEFVRNDVLLVSNVSAQPAAEAFYVTQDAQPAGPQNTVLRYDTSNSSMHVEPVRFVVHVSQGNKRGFAKASTAILDDAGQVQRKYCTVKDDKETQNVIATTVIGNQPSEEGSLALTVSFTVDRLVKGETKQ